MKKIVLSVLAFVLLANAAELITNTNIRTSVTPADVKVYKLYDNDRLDDNDSLDAAEFAYAGPYNLADDVGAPMHKGFWLSLPVGAIESGDSIAVYYGILPGNELSDTTGVWTALDTIAATEGISEYVDLSNVAGRSIVIRIENVDATAASIAKNTYLMFKRNKAYEVQSR